MTELEALQQRVVQLEELFSHNEQLVMELNQTLVALRADHDKLQAMCVEQNQRLAVVAERQAMPMDPDEKPPHY